MHNSTINITKRNKYAPSIAAIALALLGLLLFAGCTNAGEESEISGAAEVSSPRMAVETAVVRRGRLRDSISASGIIRGYQEAIIRPQTSGIIQSVNFELGDKVDGESALVVLDDRIALLNYQQVQRQYSTAAADLESQRALYNRGSISQNQLNQAQANADGLASRLQQAKDAYENSRIVSPISGSIADKAENLIPGDSVSSGQQIARVVDLTRLRIQLAFGQDQIFMIRSGQSADVLIRSPGEEIRSLGTVAAVAAGSDPSTGSWKVIVEFENPRPDLIKAGMSATVRISSDVESEREIVPASAVLNAESTPSLFLVDGEIASQQYVQILDSYGEQVAVRLTSGEELVGRRVLTSGITRIQNGDLITWNADAEVGTN